MAFDPNLSARLRGRTELLTPRQAVIADQLAAAQGVSGRQLMANAGRAVARWVVGHMRPCRTLVLCGPGNNGGDGYVAARFLQLAGWPVTVAALGPPRDAGGPNSVAHAWTGPTAPFRPDTAGRADLVVDAVFGAGLSRDVDGVVAGTLAAARRIVAVDIPSGVDGDTGAVRGKAAPALATVTFFRLKPGHLLLPGRDLCGEIVLADIGLPSDVLTGIQSTAHVNAPTLWRLPVPASDGHKYSRGHVTVVGGDSMTGAARLAAEGARRGGAGLVTIAVHSDAANVYRTGAPGLIVSDAPVTDLLRDARRHVWICGPGLGPEAANAILPRLIAANRCVVADADALTACAGEPERLRGVSVITPHSGEFARVFGDLGADRPLAAVAAAQRTGAVVLLKGADTIVAAPGGRISINASAPPWLATAGAGDVLAGLIAGLLAQGMPAWEAASAAAWLHGRAAFIAGSGMVAEDILVALPAALSDATR